MGLAPASAMIDVLIPIWRRALQRSDIGVDDNFFDLGGDPASASLIFSEIARVTGRELSPLTIYQAPTIAEIAPLITQKGLPLLKPAVQLRRGSSGSPIFFAHGLNGSVMEFFGLLKHIESWQPLFGLQTKGIEGLSEPLDRIEDMAAFYLDAIREIQPRGPYALVGYSLGGLVVLEMARRLLEKGQGPSLLVMIDSYPHFCYLPVAQKARIVGRRLRRFTSSRLSQEGNRSGSTPIRPQFGRSFARTMQSVNERAEQALFRYRPRFYEGRIKFLKAEISTEFADNPVEIWSKLVSEVEVEVVPGDHLEMLAKYASNLGAILSRYFGEVLS